VMPEAVWLGLQIGALVAVLLLAWLTIRYSLLIPAVRGLPILMYHQVHASRCDALTVTADQFDQHLEYLLAGGYVPITCRQLIDHLDAGTPLPQCPVLITFDDGYVNNIELAYPLLQRHGFKATIFLPVGLLGQTNHWDDGREPLVSRGDLAQLDPNVIELGLHSFAHISYQAMSPAEIAADARRCVETLAAEGIPCCPALAYPYGKYPREPAALANLERELTAAGIGCGLRIGNRVNRLPIRHRFEVRRINIKGTDSPWAFRTKVRKGRVKLF
jgi:peptidoglycan/xylan/chitin deacetylase (PgdA/CDA1 family)